MTEYELELKIKRLNIELNSARAQIAAIEATDRRLIEENGRLQAQIAAKDAALRGIWDWWYGEKRGHAMPEEFAAFLQKRLSDLDIRDMLDGAYIPSMRETE